MSKQKPDINVNVNPVVNMNFSGEDQIRALNDQLEVTKRRLVEVEQARANLQTALSNLTQEYSEFRFGTGIQDMEADLSEFQNMAARAAIEFEEFVNSVGLGEAMWNDWGDAPQLKVWYEKIQNGSMTVREAIAKTKAEYADLLAEFSSSGEVDTSTLRSFVSALDRIDSKIDEVMTSLADIQEYGVKAIGGVGVSEAASSGVGAVGNDFKELAQAIKEVAAESAEGYAPVTNFVEALVNLGSIDNNSMAGVVQAFRNIAAIGQGSYGEKSINNIVTLVQRLKDISKGGIISVSVDFSGIENLKVRKTSLNNLVEYLPRLAEVSASKLEKLSKVDLTNFNNVKVSKASMENITKLAEATEKLSAVKAAAVTPTDNYISIDIPDLSTAGDASKKISSLRGVYSSLAQSLKQLNTYSNLSGLEQYETLADLFTTIGDAASAAGGDVDSFETIITESGFSSSAAAIEELKTAVAEFNLVIQETNGQYPKAVEAVKNYYSQLMAMHKAQTDITQTQNGWRSESGEWTELANSLNKAEAEYKKYIAMVKNGLLSEEEAAKIMRVEEQEARKLAVAIENLLNKETQQQGVKTGTAYYTSAAKAAKDYYSLLSSLNKNKTDITESGGVYSSESGSWADLARELTTAKEAFDSLTSSENLQKMSSEQVAQVKQLLIDLERKYRLEMEQTTNTENSSAVSLANVYQTLAQAAKLIGSNPEFSSNAQFQTLNELYKQIGAAAAKAGGDVEVFKDAVVSGEGGFSSGAAAIEALKTAIAEFNLQVQQAKNAPILPSNLVPGTQEYNAALKQVNEQLQKVLMNLASWTKAEHGSASGQYKIYAEQAGELQALIDKLKTGELTNDKFAESMRTIQFNCESASSAIIAAGEGAKSSSLSFKTLIKNVTQYFSVISVLGEAVQLIRKMVSAVTDLDTAMTELKKVTDATEERYDIFLTNAIARAKELGATVADTVTATADFARLGYSLGEAESLADAAIVYKNVGDGISDISEASESIISTMQAYSDEVNSDDAMLIVDKFNAIGNAYAISSQGVGEALQRSAAAMASANNTLDETIALATAANTVVQNPETVGEFAPSNTVMY